MGLAHRRHHERGRGPGVIPPVRILTVLDDEAKSLDRCLAVNRADRGDSNVVISFNDRRTGLRDAIGIPPDAAIEFAIAILNAAQEVKACKPQEVNL